MEIGKVALSDITSCILAKAVIAHISQKYWVEKQTSILDIQSAIFNQIIYVIRQEIFFTSWRIFPIRKPAGIKLPHSFEREMTKMFSGLRIKKMHQGFKVQWGNS